MDGIRKQLILFFSKTALEIKTSWCFLIMFKIGDVDWERKAIEASIWSSHSVSFNLTDRVLDE